MLQAYLDRLCVQPGEPLTIHASAATDCRVSVRRMIHSDPHPDGPDVIVERCDWGASTFSAAAAAPQTGSFAVVTGAFASRIDATISLWFCPTDLRLAPVIVSWSNASGTHQLEIADGYLTLAGPQRREAVPSWHQERQWHFLGVAFGSGENVGSVTLFSATWGRTGGPFARIVEWPSCAPEPASPLLIGAVAGEPSGWGQLDGIVAGLKVHPRALDLVDLMNEMNGFGQAGAATWDLADASDPDSAPASTPTAAPLQLVHAPARSGVVPPPVDDSTRPLVAPGAVHFHRDDTEDCAWPAASQIAVPPTARSGLYSARLASAGEEFELPFIVSGRSAVTLLVPTLTWQAYANLGRDPAVWPGRSHYAVHTDGSPVFVTTSRKPTATFAPDARVQVDEGDGFLADGGVAHLLMADLYAEYWLTQTGEHAVMDDRDLHAGGSGALDSVTTLVLSAHPEYWTASMLEAVDTFLDQGGNVICLGGNGLYWVTSLHPAKPHLMEVRRWAGSQTSSAAQPERMHQFEVCRGGTWTDNGRPPNRILGVSFAGFGGGDPMTYRRTPASFDPEWSWVFDGVVGDVVGVPGLNTGAGNEYDRFDESRMTAGKTTVLATSPPTGGDAFGAYEESGARAPSEHVRADMTITRTRAGGLVFSLSSITASGCLPVSPPENSIAQICSNVLGRMLAGG